MITLPVLALGASAVLADLVGWGHQWGSLAILMAVFFGLREMGDAGWRRLLTAALVFSVFVAVLAVVQVWFVPRSRGPFASPNTLGAFAVLMFFLAVACVPEGGLLRVRDPVRFRAGAVAANLLSLALSQSRGAILALGAGLAVLALRRPHADRHDRIDAVAIIVVAAGAAWLMRPEIDPFRLHVWQWGWSIWMDRPLTGWGIGGVWVVNGGRYYSVPLEWAMQTGIIGLEAAAWLYVAAVRRAWDQPAMLAFLAAWLVQGIFLFSIPATIIPFFAVLAYLDRPDREPALAEPVQAILLARIRERSLARRPASSPRASAGRWCARSAARQTTSQ